VLDSGVVDHVVVLCNTMKEILATIVGLAIAITIAVAGLLSTIYIYNLIIEDSIMDTEYQIEIINEHVVKIRSTETGRIYIVPMDSIQETFIKDNL
jgi:hypothetical protein